MTMTMTKRRSNRLRLTFPILVEGMDAEGGAFEAPGRAVNLNRFGAQIQLAHPLDRGQSVRVVNPIGGQSAKFRVVEPIVHALEINAEYGVECLDADKSFWGIEFLPIEETAEAEATALLECRRCHSAAVLPMTLTEVGVLRTFTMVAKFCGKCIEVTPWVYADVQKVVAQYPDFQAAIKDSVKRKHRRVYTQLPLAVRNEQGDLMITRTENISRGGICFPSDKDYDVGEVVYAICPFQRTPEDAEVRTRIVRLQALAGEHSRLYGAAFQPVDTLVPMMA